jgi:hypothetical protein
MTSVGGIPRSYDAWTRSIPLCSSRAHARATSPPSAADTWGRQTAIDQKRQYNSRGYLDAVGVIIKVGIDVPSCPAAERAATDLGPGPAREVLT